MSVTYGFYNSKNKDRRYNAIQMSSIFDGIVVDGILMHVGQKMMVSPNGGMMITVGSGRAWFNHTWTLNDSLLPLTVEISELILNRIDAVVLEIDSRESVRANSIKIIKGTPATNPVNPTLVKTNDRWQYPLAYIRVNKGVTEIRDADITNCVGTSEAPFATCPLEKMEIDDLIKQWKDEWAKVYEAQVAEGEFWKEQWRIWFLAQTTEIQNAYKDWEEEWNAWFAKQTSDMEATNAAWKTLWNDWFYSYTDAYSTQMADWRTEEQQKWLEWWAQLKYALSGQDAGNIMNLIYALQEKQKECDFFHKHLKEEHSIWYDLIGTSYTEYKELQDSNDANVLDSDTNPVLGRVPTEETIYDSSGDIIYGRVIFAIK